MLLISLSATPLSQALILLQLLLGASGWVYVAGAFNINYSIQSRKCSSQFAMVTQMSLAVIDGIDNCAANA